MLQRSPKRFLLSHQLKRLHYKSLWTYSIAPNIVLKQIETKSSSYLQETIRTAVMYPNTVNLLKDKPKQEFDHGLYSNSLIPFIQTNQTFQAYSIKHDILLVVKLLQKCNTELLAAHVDMIQLYHGGSSVLRIYKSPDIKDKIQTTSELDKSISIDLTYLQSTIYKAAVLEREEIWKIVYRTAVIVCMLLLVLLLVERECFKKIQIAWSK